LRMNVLMREKINLRSSQLESLRHEFLLNKTPINNKSLISMKHSLSKRKKMPSKQKT
jgi:hypothetical protein